MVGSGLTILNYGSIIGGGVNGDAIAFVSGVNSLSMAAGSSLTGNISVKSGASVTFDQRAFGDATLSNVVTGAGSVVIDAGRNTFTLGGVNTYTRATTVQSGILWVKGSIATSSLTTVQSGVLLSGTGTVGALTVANGGTFSPGSGVPGSSMSIVGALTFAPGSVYLVWANPTTASSANVTKTATLTGGTVAVNYAPGLYLAKRYTILTATGGFGGTTFAGVRGNISGNLGQTLSYDANNVFLDLTADLGGGLQGRLPGNAGRVANGVNSYFNGGGLLPPNFVNLFPLSGPALSDALARLSGEASTFAQQTGFQAGGRFLGAMLDPTAPGRGGGDAGGGGVGSIAPALAYAANEQPLYSTELSRAFASVLKQPAKSFPLYQPRWNAWANSFGGFDRIGGDPFRTGSHNVSSSLFGMAAGLDYHVTPESVLGVAMAGGATSWSLSESFGGGRGDFIQSGVYGSTRIGAAYASAAFAFTNHWIDTQRTAAFANALTGRFSAQTYGRRFESGYRVATGFGGVTPYLAVQSQSTARPGYTETDTMGGGFALTYRGRSSSDTRGELGGRFDHVIGVYGDAALLLRARTAYAHDWVSNPTLSAAFAALPGSGFVVEGAKPIRNAALASAGAELRLADGAALFGKFDGEFSARSQSYMGSAGMRYSW